MIASKNEWRVEMRQASASWLQKPADTRAAAHAALEKNLHQIMQGAEGIWGCYAALPDEPALNVFDHDNGIGSLSALHWAFPKIESGAVAQNRNEPAMRFFIPKTKDSFLSSTWGLREPNPDEAREVASENLAGLLIPALAFDRTGIRLGRGKGYYDKYLSDFRGTKVGIAYSWQIVENLPHESFDIPMDIIVTDQEAFRPQQELK